MIPRLVKPHNKSDGGAPQELCRFELWLLWPLTALLMALCTSELDVGQRRYVTEAGARTPDTVIGGGASGCASTRAWLAASRARRVASPGPVVSLVTVSQPAFSNSSAALAAAVTPELRPAFGLVMSAMRIGPVVS